MRLNQLSLITLLFAGTAGVAQAQQLNFNEIYASMTSTDTAEFIELKGTPGMSLNGYVVVGIDGQGGAQGRIDRVWDLNGLSVPMDGYFVMGNIATVPNTDYDLANGPHTTGGTENNIENGTQTFYLLQVPSSLDRDDLANALFDNDLDPDDDQVTFLSGTPGFTIVENLAMMTVLGDPHDRSYDCAPEIGPDGTFFPAGIYRPGDYPNDWCGDAFLDFNNPGGPDQTPGAPNITAACGVSIASGNGCGSTTMGMPFCDPMNLNEVGLSTKLTGVMSAAAQSGLRLEVNDGPPGNFGYFLIGTGASDPGTNVSNGRLCLAVVGGNQFGRYNVTGGLLNSVGTFDASGALQNQVGTSSTGAGFDVPNLRPTIGGNIMTGETWHFQLWHRESGGNSNFSNGLTVTF